MTQKKTLLTKLLIAMGAGLLFLILCIVGLGILIVPGKPDFSASYNPFKSERAKEKYFAAYDKRAEQWPVESTTQMIETSYGETFVRISGLEGAEPVVLMHGVGGNSLQWLPNVEALAGRFRVYAIDNIYDNGRSVPSRTITTADDYVSWLDEVFDGLEIGDSVNVVGLSYGGWIAANYALRNPDRLNKVVLLAPVGTVAKLAPGWIARAIPVAIPLKYFARSFSYWLAEDTMNSGAEGKALVDEMVDETFLASRSFNAKSMVNPSVLNDEELQSLSMPILFMVGENEKIYSPDVVLQRLADVAPQIRSELITGAGHDLTLVQAERVNELMLEFLGGV